MTDALDILIDDPVAMLLWVALALIASLTNGLLSLLQYRKEARAGRRPNPPDYISHMLEFVVVVGIEAMAFLCRLTVGKLLHAPLFYTSILVAVAGVEVGRTVNRYLEMRGVSRRINLGNAIDKALGNTPAKDIIDKTDKQDII